MSESQFADTQSFGLLQRRRIINMDESHLLMTTEVEKGGPRASVYHDPSLGAPQRSKVVNPRHTTNSNGKAVRGTWLGLGGLRSIGASGRLHSL